MNNNRELPEYHDGALSFILFPFLSKLECENFISETFVEGETLLLKEKRLPQIGNEIKTSNVR